MTATTLSESKTNIPQQMENSKQIPCKNNSLDTYKIGTVPCFFCHILMMLDFLSQLVQMTSEMHHS